MKHVIPLPYGTRLAFYDVVQQHVRQGPLALALIYSDEVPNRHSVAALTVRGEQSILLVEDYETRVKFGGYVGLFNTDGTVEDFRTGSVESGVKVVARGLMDELDEYNRANPKQGKPS